MTLNEIKQEKLGTYAAVRFSKSTIDRLTQFCVDNGVKNALKPSKLHTTLLYSRKHLPDYEALGDLDSPWIGSPKEFVVWDTRSEDDAPPTRCLILKFECKQLEDRHEFLMKEHGATYDFDTYHPHISLSYDIGNDEIDSLTGKINDIGDIEIVHEYTENLILGWDKKVD